MASAASDIFVTERQPLRQSQVRFVRDPSSCTAGSETGVAPSVLARDSKECQDCSCALTRTVTQFEFNNIMVCLRKAN